MTALAHQVAQGEIERMRSAHPHRTSAGRADLAIKVLASLSGLLGAFVLAGWHVNVRWWLGAEHLGSVPMAYNTALVFVALGFALWAIETGRRWPVPIVAGAAGVVCVLTLAEYIVGVPAGVSQLLHPKSNRVAPNTALSLTLLVASVCVMACVRRPAHRAGVLAALGSIAASIGVSSIFGYCSGLDTFEWGIFTPMSILTAAGVTFSGAAVMIASWRENRDHARQIPWLGIAATVFFATTTLSLWHALDRREADLIERLAGALPAQRFYLDEVVLTGGLGVALLLGFALHMAQKARSQLAQRIQAQGDLDQFFALSVDMLCVADVNGYFKHLNAAWTRTLGFSSAELMAEPFINFIHPEDRAETIKVREKLHTGDQVIGFQNRYRTSHGDYRWIEWNSILRRERNLIYAAAHDVTERRLAEEAIKESEERFRLLSENTPGLIWTCLPSGNCDYLNPQWLEYAGKVGTGRFGYEWLNRLHPEDREEARKSWSCALAQNSAFESEFRIQRRDGRYRWFKSRATPLRNEEGRVVKWFGTNIDIDDLRRAEQARREGEALLRAVLDTIDDAVYLKDREGRMIVVNPALLRILGKSAGEVIGRTATEYLADPAMALVTTENDRIAMETGQTQVMEEKTPAALGSRIFLSTRSPWLDSNGQVMGLVCVSRDITGRKHSEEALRQSEERFHHLFESMDEGFAVCQMIYGENGDPIDFRFELVNPAFSRLTGISVDRLVGETAIDAIPDIAPFWIETYGRIARTGQSERIEGEVGVLGKHLEMFAWCSEPGRIGVVFGDVTERRRAERELRESKERLSLAIESAELATWDWDVAADKVVWSDLGSAMMGLSSCSGTYERFLDIVHEDDRDRIRADMRGAVENRQRFQAEMQIVWPDGSVRWLSLLGRASSEGPGESERMNGVMLDITERKEVEQKLRWMQLIVESSHDAIVSKDVNGVIRSWNSGAERVYGYSAPEAVGKSISILIPADNPGELARIQEDGRTGNGLDRCEMERVRKDGRRIWVSLTASPMRDAAGRVTGTCSIGRDITFAREIKANLEQKAQELARSNSELELFAYVASHDLQEPLRLIANYTQLIADRYRGKLDSDADEFIAYAVDGCTRMQTLIKDLLAYSRVGRKGKAFERIDCNEVFERAVANLQIAIDDSGASVVSSELPVVSGDRGQLTQLFQNLIGNALKFRTPEPPNISLGAVREGKEWLFSVKDNGIGIEPEFANRIFVMFQRLHTADEYPGTGIGLAICKKIVERHGGQIWVSSQPGEGSTFSFTIPAEGCIQER